MSVRKVTWTTKDGKEQSSFVLFYSVKNPSGERERKQETFPTKKAAEEREAEIRRELTLGTHIPARDSKTISEVWDTWITHCIKEGLERGTIQQRRQHLKLHVAPFIGQRKITELTAPGVNEYLDALRDNGRSTSMRRKVLVNLRTVLKFAQGRGYVTQNVALVARVQKESGRDEAPLTEGVDFPTRSEIGLLIQNAPARWRPFMITAAFTGMRVSELRGLTWKHVDLDAGVILVRGRADKWGTLGKPKSKKGNRDIPLAPIVINALRQWAQVCPKGALNLVFPNGQGNTESLTNIHRRMWVPIQIKCGLTDSAGKHRYGFHMLRHAACSLFIAYLGWTPKKISTVMGHSSINITFDLYGHMFENKAADQEAMQKLEAAIGAA
jgi:integrase